MRDRESAGSAKLEPKAAGWRAAGRNAVASVRSVVSPMGAIFAILSVLCGGIGLVMGWPELVGVAGALAAGLIFGTVACLGRADYTASVALSRLRVKVGDQVSGNVMVRNRMRRRTWPSQAELTIGQTARQFRIPRLKPLAEFSLDIDVPTSHRAVMDVGPLYSQRGDPLGLVRRRVKWAEPQRVFVHPRITQLESLNAGVVRDLEGQTTAVISDDDLDFHGLREYQEGDDVRNIHWLSTARVGNTMVRQFEDTRRTTTALALATDANGFQDGAEFELAVSAFASIGVQCLRDRRPLAAYAGETMFRGANASHFLDRTCAIAMGAGPGEDPGKRIEQNAPDASLYVLIFGSGTSASDAMSHMNAMSRSVRCLSIICESGSRRTIKARQGRAVARIGELQDLRWVMKGSL